MKIAFIGLGRMGEPMARNLLKTGFEVCVYNRTVAKAVALQADGAAVAATPALAARGAQAAVTMLSDDAALEAAVLGPSGLLAGLAEEGIHVSMSTVSPALTERLDGLHRDAGRIFVAAPVFGRPDAAAAAKLFIVAAGPAQARSQADAIFGALGQRTFWTGEKPALANVVKLAGNSLLAAMIQSFGEAFALSRKWGVSSEVLLDILTNTLFTSPAQKNYAGIIAHERFTPAGFSLKLGLKDVRLALDAAQAAGVPMPAARLIEDRFAAAVERGFADLDWSALAKLEAEDAGLGG
jgi:3-hydroxyisobutyrate dehydrogenase-like beta-hydroxyacid dehydrogenase